jgi:hypothetical protein
VLDPVVYARDAEEFCKGAALLRCRYDAGLAATLDLADLFDDFAHIFRPDSYGELLELEAEPKP